LAQGIAKRILKQHGHHVIFVVSILSLASLTAWWTVFINRSIDQYRALHMDNLESELRYLSLKLGNNEKAPEPGVFRKDNRFEIGLCGTVKEPLKKSLKPLWPHLCIRIIPSALEVIEKDYKRKKLMLVGESMLMALIVMLGSFLLYRYIQLEKRSAMQVEEFWERVTHEIKTPITGIKAFLQSIKSRSLDPYRLPQFVDMALKQVEKQEQLAENILAGYGLRAGDKENKITMKDLNLNLFLDAYFDQHIIRLTDTRLLLRTGSDTNSAPVPPVTAQADPDRLKAILDNIVDNALKYCSPGLELTVGVFIENKKAVISIDDNGPGIQPGFTGKIFDAYKYLDSELPGKLHGSGMGLYISRQLAGKMGGQLSVSTNTETGGSRFQLSLNLSKMPQG
jgi:signal transduction histidine kinase